MSIPTMNIEYLPAASLKPHPKNPKIHPDRQKREIADSLDEFGWLIPVLVNQRTGYLLSGHARVEIAAKGHSLVPVRFVDVPPATEDRILAALDRTGELANYDEKALANLLAGIVETSEDLPPGWESNELDDLLKSVGEIPESPGASSVGDFEEEPPDTLSFNDPLDDAPNPSTPRMFYLYLPLETEPVFRAMVERLGEAWETGNSTDIVYRAVETVYRQEFEV